MDTFNGQIFTVDLGPVEQARNVSESIDKRALITVDGEVDSTVNNGNTVRNISEATATLKLPPLLFRNCINSQMNMSTQTASRQRLSYSVFLTDALFLPVNRTLNKVGSIVVGARASCQLDNEAASSVPIQTSFQILKMVRWVFYILNIAWEIFLSQLVEIGSEFSGMAWENGWYMMKCQISIFLSSHSREFTSNYTQLQYFNRLTQLTAVVHYTLQKVSDYIGEVNTLSSLTFLSLSSLSQAISLNIPH